MGFNLAFGIPDTVLEASTPSLDVDENRAVWCVRVTIINYAEIKAAYERAKMDIPEEEFCFYWPVDDQNSAGRYKREAMDFANSVNAGHQILS